MFTNKSIRLMSRNGNIVHERGDNLPRLGKGEFSDILVCKELYRKAIEVNPEYKSVDYKEFQRIWVLIAEKIKEEISENPLGVKLPFFLGELKVQYLPYRKKTDDRVASAEVGESIPHLNFHSKGKNGKLIWERKDARKYNKILDLWAFEPSDLLRDSVSKELVKNPDKFRVAKTRIINRKNEK